MWFNKTPAGRNNCFQGGVPGVENGGQYENILCNCYDRPHKTQQDQGQLAIFKAKIVSGGYRWSSLTCFAGIPAREQDATYFFVETCCQVNHGIAHR
jgi:hypothetical protein